MGDADVRDSVDRVLAVLRDAGRAESTVRRQRLPGILSAALLIQPHRPLPGLLVIFPLCRHPTVSLASSKPPGIPVRFNQPCKTSR